MSTHELKLTPLRMSQVRERMLAQKERYDNNVRLHTIQRRAFDQKMNVLSLTPRPSMIKNQNDEAHSNYDHLRLAKTMEIRNQQKQPLRTSNTPTPKPSLPVQNKQAVQQLLKLMLNFFLIRDLATQTKLTKEKLARKHAIEEKTAEVEHRNSIGMDTSFRR